MVVHILHLGSVLHATHPRYLPTVLGLYAYIFLMAWLSHTRDTTVAELPGGFKLFGRQRYAGERRGWRSRWVTRVS